MLTVEPQSAHNGILRSWFRRELLCALDNIGLESLLVAIMAVAALIMLARNLFPVSAPAVHPMLTAGYITWFAQSKTADYILPAIVLLASVPILLATGWIHSFVTRMWGSDVAGELRSLTFACALPGIAGIGIWLVNAGGEELI